MPLSGYPLIKIANKINDTLIGVWLSEKLQLTTALYIEIRPQLQIWLMLLWAIKLETAKIECSFGRKRASKNFSR